MRTAFIGAYGYGNLGDELCLIEAMRAFPSSEAHAFTVDPEWTGRCVPGLASTFRDLEGLLAMQPERVVFGGGGIGTARDLSQYMPWLRAAQKRGAACHIHNIGVAILPDLSWLTSDLRLLFAGMASFTVRDYKSAEIVAKWDLGLIPGLSRYPERGIEADRSIAKHLPRDGKLLGVSIINTPGMARCLDHDAERVRALLREFNGWAVVPIVSTSHRSSVEEDDARGFRYFAERFLVDADVVLPEMLDRKWWYATMTPRRLKDVIARCNTLISHRKHNCVHAIGAGTRVIGLHPQVNDSIPRTFLTLHDRLPQGSRYVGLRESAAQAC